MDRHDDELGIDNTPLLEGEVSSVADNQVDINHCAENSEQLEENISSISNDVLASGSQTDNELSLENVSFSVAMRDSKIFRLLCLVFLVAFGTGCTLGVVPAVMTDRFARLQHGYSDDLNCEDYNKNRTITLPEQCEDGSADAQHAVAIEQLILHTLSFLSSSLVGSISDEYGRKWAISFSILLSFFPSLSLVLIQTSPEMSPIWYYSTGAMCGLVNLVAVALSSMSDALPAKWRTGGFGLLLAIYALGYTLSPIVAIFLNHFQVSLLSLVSIYIAFIFSVTFLPETLSTETALEAKLRRQHSTEGIETYCNVLKLTLHRPFRELSILNRNEFFRLLACLAFLTSAVSSGDRALLTYYVEEKINFDDKDVATMFAIMGFTTILIQAFLLKPFNELVGERNVILFALLMGSLSNFTFGFASSKIHIFFGVGFAAFVNMALPTIAAMKANNVESSEQGRIQGALYSIKSLASACGPFLMEEVYRSTWTGKIFGSGTMFVLAAILSIFAMMFACMLDADSILEK